MELRPYQAEALEALHAYLNDGRDGALLELATGTGKSLVMAQLCKDLVQRFHDCRIVAITHVQELIAQNAAELSSIWLSAPVGIFSAGLGKRQSDQQITFCGIQSVHDKADRFGSVDLLLIDEAHLVPKKAHTMYGRFIAALREANPQMRLVGLTATSFRLGSGRLDQGDDRLFNDTVYTYGIKEGVRDGYLAKLSSKGMETTFDLTGVHKKGGEYVESELQAAVDKDETTRRAVGEAVAYGRDRRSWIAFCSGVAHAFHVRDAIRSHGFTCETIVGSTPKEERAEIIEAFKRGNIRCLTNNTVLTTGFNAPAVDMILALRPTESASLYLQMCGRGTRNAPGKSNCLVLDYARWVERHGPVDEVRSTRASKGSGVAPIKTCPSCFELIRASARECPECGHQFESSTTSRITARASNLSIMSVDKDPPTWVGVTGRTFHAHFKPDKPTTVLTKFKCGFVTHKAWYAPESGGRARAEADKFWLEHGGKMPAPRTADAWLDRVAELQPTSEIAVRQDGKYLRVVGTKSAEELAFGL